MFTNEYLQMLEGKQIMQDVGRNLFIREMLRLALFMVQHGFYKDEAELEGLIEPIISLIDGTLDAANEEEYNQAYQKRTSLISSSSRIVPFNSFEKADKSRYILNNVSQLTMECKVIICQILNIILEIRVDAQMGQFLHDYKSEQDGDPSENAVLEHMNSGKLIQAGGKVQGAPVIVGANAIQQNARKLAKIMTIGIFNFGADDELDEIEYSIPQSVRTPILWFERILQNSSLELRNQMNGNYVPILLDLLQYQSMDLVHNVFKLLLSSFSQRQRLIFSLKKIQLLEHEADINSLRNIQDQLDYLRKDAEDAEHWLGRDFTLVNSGPEAVDAYSRDNVTVIRQDRVNRTLENLAMLCQTQNSRLGALGLDDNPEPEIEDLGGNNMSQNASISSQKAMYIEYIEGVSENEAGWDYEPKLFSKKEVPNRDMQKLLRNLRVYEHVIEIIKQRGINRYYSQTRHYKTLRYCYLFLTKFVRQNTGNQQILFEYLDDFIEDIKKNVFALSLIKEIFRNNLKLCLDVPIALIKSISKIVDECPISQKKSYMLRATEVLMKCKGKVLKNNQTEIMTLIASSNKTNTIILYNNQQELQELEMEIQQLLRQSTTPDSYIQITDKVYYLITLLEVMAVASEDKSAQAEAICQHVLPLPHFARLLKVSSHFWPLKRSLILFFLHVYLDIEFSMQEDEEILWNTVGTMRDDLKIIFQQITITTNSQFQLRFRLYDGVQSNNEVAWNYVYYAIIPCLHEVLTKRGNNLNMERNGLALQEIIELIYQFHTFAGTQYQNITGDLLKLIGEIDKLQKFLRQENEQFIYKHQVTTINHKIDMLQDFPSNAQPVESDRAAKFHKAIRKMLKLQIVQDSLEIEFEELIKSILDIGRLSVQSFGEDNSIRVEDLVISLIKLLHISNGAIKKDERLVGLKIFRKMVEVENREMTTPASEWDTEDWSYYENIIRTRQNMLGTYGAVELLMEYIIQYDDTPIQAECILLAIAMLLGGNKQVQDRFLLVMQNDNSNMFILKIRDIMISLTEKVRHQQVYQLSASIKRMKESMKNQYNFNDPDHSGESTDNEDGYMQFQNADEDDDDEGLNKHYGTYQMLVNVLRFIQLLCEGHHQQLQNYLRQQVIDGSVHSKSFDFITSISDMLAPYVKILRRDNLSLGYQIIDTLTELVQGPCRENQRVLSQPKIIDSGRDLLVCLKKQEDAQARGFDLEEDSEEISNLKSKIVNFILSLLEGDADEDIMRRITDSLDFNKIKERMYEVFSQYVTQTLELELNSKLNEINSRIPSGGFNDLIYEGFNLYILMNKLADEYPPAAIYVNESMFKPEEYFAFSFFKMHTGRIEVVVDGMLTRTYFPIQPVCRHMSEISKDKLKYSVDRSSASNKIVDLIIKAKDLIEEMNYNEQFGRSSFQLNADKINGLKDISLLILIGLNFMFLFDYDYDRDYPTAIGDWILPDYCDVVIRISWLLLIMINALVLVGWLTTRAQLVVKRGWRIMIEGCGEIEPVSDIPVNFLPSDQTRRILYSRGPDAEEFNKGEHPNFGNAITRLCYLGTSSKFVIMDPNFQYFVFYIVLCILGIYEYTLFSVLLLDVIYKFPSLRNILSAVTTNWDQLAMTAMLGVILIYIYSVLGFYIDKSMWFDKFIGANGENQCQNLWQCFLTTWNIGIRMGGGIGEALSKINFFNESIYYERLVYDISFFIIVIIIILNIVLGIIIDTFAQLRDQKKFTEEDMRNKCFICDEERQKFDRFSYGFDKHIKQDHNMWQYIFFLVHLELKDSTEYNGTESFCSDMLSVQDISWIPLHKALCLKHLEMAEEEDKEANEQLVKRLDNLENGLDYVLSSFRGKFANSNHQTYLP